MEKKEPLGFKTPSMRIQEEYKEILEQLMAKKANWEKVLTSANNMFEFAQKGVEGILKEIESKEETHEYLMELEHRTLALAHSFTQVIVSRIGKELAECDVRIAALEKESKDLRKSRK